MDLGLVGKTPATKLDPVAVDGTHFKVLLDNDYVRVLRVHYGPVRRVRTTSISSTA